MGEEFVVEKIVAKKVVNGKLYYEVKWENWDHSDNTWEPVENVMACQGMIDEFEKKLKDQKKNSQLNLKNFAKKKPGQQAGDEQKEERLEKAAEDKENDGEEKEDGNKSKHLDNIIDMLKTKSSTPEITEKSDALVPPPPPPTNGRTKTASKEKSKSTEQKKIGYERGLKPVEIVGTTDKEGKLVYLIKWEDCEFGDFVDADEVINKNPEIVEKFYAERQTWH